MTHRALTIPVSYTIEFKKTPRHKAAPQSFYSMVEIEILELDPLEAPIAASYEKFLSPGGRTHIRVHDGVFYRPVTFEQLHPTTYQPGDPEFMTVETFSQRLAALNWDGLDLPRISAPVLYKRGQLAEFDPFDFSDEIRHRQRSLIEHVRQCFSRFAVIGDLTYTRTVEPYYQVQLDRTSGRPTATVIAADAYGRGSAEHLFALSSFEEASDYAEQRFGQALDPNDAAEILIPEAFTVGDVRPVIVSMLQTAVGEHKSELEYADVETLVAWAKLRDAVARVSNSDQLGDDQIEEVFSVHAEAYANSPAPRPAALKKISHAFERWSLRPIIRNEHGQGITP